MVDDSSGLDEKHNEEDKFILKSNQKIIIPATTNKWKKAQTKRRAKELYGADKVLDSEADCVGTITRQKIGDKDVLLCNE